jgi:hypothetical protein
MGVLGLTGNWFMPHHSQYDDEWDDDSYIDDDWNEDEDYDDPSNVEDLETTTPCPYCHREIHKESEHCPYCKRWLSEEDAPSSRKPWWIILGVILGLIVVYYWITRR